MTDTLGVTVTHEPVPDFDRYGVLAFTTTREAGSFALGGSEAAGTVVGRWRALMSWLAPRASRLAMAHQVHANLVLEHVDGWQGWLRAPDADGHLSRVPGTAMAVTLADCVPVFMAHPSGAAAVLHAGWRGTVAGIVARGADMFRAAGFQLEDVRVHLGPAICGRCYEVGPEVIRQLTGRAADAPAPVDLRAIIAYQARAAGCREISFSQGCTRCHNDRFFSHRAGDAGRHLGVIVTAR